MFLMKGTIMSLFRIAFPYTRLSSLIGSIAICLGDNQNGHFPPVCSHKIANILSTDPKIALCTITGLSNPGFNSLIPTLYILSFWIGKWLIMKFTSKMNSLIHIKFFDLFYFFLWSFFFVLGFFLFVLGFFLFFWDWCSSVFQTKSCGKDKIELNGTTLVRSSKCVQKLNINLWPIKSSILRILFPWLTELIQCCRKLCFSKLPEFRISERIIWSSGQLQFVLKPTEFVDVIKKIEVWLDFLLDLVLSAEDMGVVLLESSNSG